MIKRKAILHILNFPAGESVLSQVELDFTQEAVDAFLEKHLEKIKANPAQKKGHFLPESPVLESLKAYKEGQNDFVSLSFLLAQRVGEVLSLGTQEAPLDFLAVEYQEEQKFLALLLLPHRKIYAHQTLSEGGQIKNEIICFEGALSGTLQQAASFAIISLEDFSLCYFDKKRIIEGEGIFALPQRILCCEGAMSSKEAVKWVQKVTAKVAEENGLNTTIAIAKAKNCLLHCGQEQKDLSAQDLGRAVFGDQKGLQADFTQRLAQKEVPPQVKMEPDFAQKSGQNHKIKTDTGIEITFPAAYVEEEKYIHFVHHADGTMSIELKNIGKITNR